jgi:hypothetical protein
MPRSSTTAESARWVAGTVHSQVPAVGAVPAPKRHQSPLPVRIGTAKRARLTLRYALHRIAPNCPTARTKRTSPRPHSSGPVAV